MKYYAKKQNLLPIPTLSTFIFYIIILPDNVNMINLSALCNKLDPTEVLFNGKNEYSPQEKNPFIVKSNSSTAEIEETVLLTLTSKKLHKFRGFIMQSRYGKDYLVGTFLKQLNTTLYDCDQDGINSPELIQDNIKYYGNINKRNTIVYNGSELIDSFSVVWEAPDYMVGDVNFFFTVYRDLKTYWQFHMTNESYVTVTFDHTKHDH